MDNLYTWENIKETQQTWHIYRYCDRRRKWLMRPVFQVKFKWSNRFERISIKIAMDNIFNSERRLFTISDDLKEWIRESKYANLLNDE